MQGFLSHLFLPQKSNNHRAKVLHHQNLVGFIVLFIIFQVAFNSIKSSAPQVLGTTTDISATKLLDLSNQQRIKYNLLPLSLNSELSIAAENKAKDMFAENYWAHFSPSGLTPWTFIKAAGYDYVYAGENLARGFTDSASVVVAWMNSPSHRENQLSPNYTDVGYAIDDGKLLGENTTLIVEMFGSTPTSLANARNEANSQQAASKIVKTTSTPNITSTGSLLGASQKASLIQSDQLAKGLVLILLSLFI